MKITTSQFSLEDCHLGMDTSNVFLNSMNVNSMRRFCEFDDFVNENIRMSHRIYSGECDFSSEVSHERERKNSIRIGSKYQAVIEANGIFAGILSVLSLNF
jgi:hypothetical protein